MAATCATMEVQKGVAAIKPRAMQLRGIVALSISLSRKNLGDKLNNLCVAQKTSNKFVAIRRDQARAAPSILKLFYEQKGKSCENRKLKEDDLRLDIGATEGHYESSWNPSH